MKSILKRIRKLNSLFLMLLSFKYSDDVRYRARYAQNLKKMAVVNIATVKNGRCEKWPLSKIKIALKAVVKMAVINMTVVENGC